MTVILLLIVAGVSLVMSAYVSFSEGALLSADRRLLKQKAEEGSKAAASTLKVVTTPSVLHGTLLLLVNVFLITFTLSSQSLLSPYFEDMQSPVFFIAPWLFVLLLEVLIIDGIVLFFGEIFPKTWAISNVSKNSLIVGPTIHRIGLFIRPIAEALYVLPAKMLGSRAKSHAPLRITEGQLRIALELGSTSGAIEQTESDLGQRVMDVAETTVDQVMSLRQDIVDLPVELTVRETIEKLRNVPYSRIPLYRGGDDDNIVGILSVKDLMGAYLSNELDRPIGSYARSVEFIPEKKRVFDLMLDFKTRRSPIALAVDEAGSITGLVTLEDCLEEVVGEIYDEHDSPEAQLRQVGDTTYIADGRLELSAIQNHLGLDLISDDYMTIGGLVMGIVGRVPTTGQKVHHHGITFTVTRMVGLRIDKVRIHFPNGVTAIRPALKT